MTLPSGRGLFVIGVARSGTTVLQNTLNHAPDVYLLGEPDLHIDDGTPGFAGRFNAMHRRWRNQPTKSTRLPLLFDEDRDWRAYLDRLADHHRWVGTKIVINPGHEPGWLERLERFHSRSFYDARYIFVFRHPDAVARSYRGMQEAAGETPHGPDRTFANYAATVALFTRMVRTFPHVRGVIHEDVDDGTLDRLGAWLGCDLTGAAGYYDGARVRHHAELIDAGDETSRQMNLLYDDLRVLIGCGIPMPQLEQNDGHFDPAHFTPIGSLDARARFLSDGLFGA